MPTYSPVNPNYSPSMPAALFPASNLEAITPSDGVSYTGIRGLWIGGAGTVSIIAANGTTGVSFTVPAGTILPIFVKVVRATGTTATNIVALY